MSNSTLATPFLLTEEQQLREARANFDSHRLRQLECLFPPESLTDTSSYSQVDCWADCPFVVNSLLFSLVWAEDIGPETYKEIVNNLEDIVDGSLAQLLYWHLTDATTLTNHPVNQLLLWSKSDYLWFYELPQKKELLIRCIISGTKIRYLDHFRLDYEGIHISFHELQVKVEEGLPDQLVITEGEELTYSWETKVWDTTLSNPDHRLINP